jgi:hypothetical protein
MLITSLEFLTFTGRIFIGRLEDYWKKANFMVKEDVYI